MDNEKKLKAILEQNIFSEGYAVTPNKLLHNINVSDFGVRLYAKISSLCATTGKCFATNEYLAESFGVSLSKVSRGLKEIDDFILISNRQSAKREIWVSNIVAKKPVKIPKKKKPKTPKPPKKKKVTVKYTQEDLSLAEYLLSKILFNFPVYENRKINIEDWADDIRKLREYDKAKPEQIYFMITWIHGGEIVKEGKQPRIFPPHDFWSQNILSASKLRKQWFNNLVPKLQQEVMKTRTVQL